MLPVRCCLHKMRNTGILIIAVGHPQYARMAENLARSIRFQSDIPICLAWGGKSISALNGNSFKYFDEMIEMPKDFYHTWHDEYLRPKVNLDQITPFKETLYLDADMIWLPWKHAKIDLLFEQLKDVDFAMPYRSSCGLSNPKKGGSDWCDLNELKHKYKFNDETYYNVSSEIMWFKKKDIIRKARKHYDTLKVNLTHHLGNSIPDELPYSIALMEKELKPNPFDSWRPVYWENVEVKNPLPGQKIENFYAFSMGGAQTRPSTQKYYNNLALFYNKQYHKWIDKSKFTTRMV